ncbi:hypothetical protein F2Q70_00010197 [Brassica cretica]|uniref:Uncharacterized protein n=1 Tax=Brassica cretica TaxID=69181 RepID=A0A8S9LT79_BRACR|nr:hypothetical protein F2Q70_00010197 [Brassica cretica]
MLSTHVIFRYVKQVYPSRSVPYRGGLVVERVTSGLSRAGCGDVPQSEHRPTGIMDTAQVHSVHTNHVFPLDHADQTVRTIPSDHPDRTARAVHRIDPQTFVVELSLEPRPRNGIDRPVSLLSQPIQHSKTDSEARFNLGRDESKDVHRFSLMALFAWILEPSKDLFHTTTKLGPTDHPKVQFVRVNHPTGRVDRHAHVLILTPSTSTTRMNLDSRRRVTLTSLPCFRQL